MKSKSGSSHFNIYPTRSLSQSSCPSSSVPASPLLPSCLSMPSSSPLPSPSSPCFTKATAKPRRAG